MATKEKDVVYVVMHNENPDETEDREPFGVWTDYKTAEAVALALNGESIAVQFNASIDLNDKLCLYRVEASYCKNALPGRRFEVIVIEKESELLSVVSEPGVVFVCSSRHHALATDKNEIIELSVVASSITAALSLIHDYFEKDITRPD